MINCRSIRSLKNSIWLCAKWNRPTFLHLVPMLEPPSTYHCCLTTLLLNKCYSLELFTDQTYSTPAMNWSRTFTQKWPTFTKRRPPGPSRTCWPSSSTWRRSTTGTEPKSEPPSWTSSGLKRAVGLFRSFSVRPFSILSDAAKCWRPVPLALTGRSKLVQDIVVNLKLCAVNISTRVPWVQIRLDI